MSTVDPLVEDYLHRLGRAAAGLPPDRRHDLLDEIGEHIAAARASGAADDEAAVRNVLDRLGDPEEIAAAAHEEVATGCWGQAPPRPGGGWGAPAYAPPPPRGTGLELAAVLLLTVGSIVPVVGWLVGVVLLWMSSLWRVREKLLGTLVFPLGPGAALYVGPLLLGQTETCTTTGGLAGTPGGGPPPPPPGPPQPAVEPPPGVPGSPPPLPELEPDGSVTMCGVSGISGWEGLALALVLVVAPIVVAALLFRTARRRAADVPAPAAGPYDAAPYAAPPTPWGPLEISAVLLLACGGFLVPVVGALVGLVLACVSPRWAVRDKVVAGGLALLPAALVLASFVLPGSLAFPLLGGFLGPFLLLLVTGPLAAAYLAVVLARRPETTSARLP